MKKLLKTFLLTFLAMAALSPLFSALAAEADEPASNDMAPDDIEVTIPQITDIRATKVFETGTRSMGIAFTIDHSGKVFIYLLDESRERVHTIDNSSYEAGSHILYWDGVKDEAYIPTGEYTLQISLKSDDRYSAAFEQPLKIISEKEYIPPIKSVYVINAGERTKITVQKSPGKGSVGIIHGSTAIVDVIKYEGAYAYIQVYNYAGKLVKGYVKKSMLKSVTPSQTYLIEIDKSKQRVNVYKNGKLERTMLCSTGKNFDTPSGEYLTGTKLPAFYVNGLTAKFATRINGGVYYHEVPNRNGSYTAYENKLGQKASAGCIRLPRGDAKWMHDNIPAQTKVIVK